MGESGYDLCVIGGGINGAGIARDAAGRGLKVLLLEQGDLASATSSASTKLIHGGLRYLEYYEFRLVHESLLERNVLLNIAPHIIWPLNFVLPDAYGIRPFWMIRLGLYLYDILSFSFQARKFPASRGFNLRKHAYGAPLKDDFFLGVFYSDGWVKDARLVVLNAMDARAQGADIRTRTRCTGLKPAKGGWTVTAKDLLNGRETTHSAKLVVNAAGPWVRDLLDRENLTTAATPKIRLVQGSHIIVPRLHDGDQAYMLQQPDKRIVFAIPYEDKFTLLGTTEQDFTGDLAAPHITAAETDYLIGAANRYFNKQVTRGDIVSTYSGVRPLLDDDNTEARKITRDYKIHEDDFGGAKLISVFGGKITTYRKLSEKVTELAARALGNTEKTWTGKRPLPGGDIPSADFNAYFRMVKIRWEHESAALLKRYLRSYGTRMIKILEASKGAHYGEDIYESEIRYLIDNEFARSLDDILWRRSKLGLHISETTRQNLANALPQLVKEITGYDIENNPRA